MGGDGTGRDGAGPASRSGGLTCKAGPGARDLSIAGRPFADSETQEKRVDRLLAAGLVTHRHELVIRNVSAEEKVSASGLWRSFPPS